MIKSTGANSTLCDKQENKIPPIVQDRQPRPLDNSIFDSYIPFINGMITKDKNNVGRIQSCVQGNRNTNKLFFNITGN
jgi:hypothetical protein